MRLYTKRIVENEFLWLYDIESWKECLILGSHNTYDGYGHWANNGFESNYEVFSTPQLNATHVVWYNK